MDNLVNATTVNRYSEIQIRGGIFKNIFFLFYNKDILCCDPSLELSQQDSYNEGSQHMFQRKNMENYLKIILFMPRHKKWRGIMLYPPNF